MEYTIDKLAKLAGVTTRALRYYDKIGLLKPKRINASGYRLYGQNEVNLLQQILFYKELDVDLFEIKKIISSPQFNSIEALEKHLVVLLSKKQRLNILITNVEKSIQSMKGEINMDDKEKFEGFKQKLIEENETKYGKEIREKFGEKVVNDSNTKLKGMSKEQWQKTQELSAEINELLIEAVKTKNPSSKEAQKVCELHKQWLCMFWQEGIYSKEAHKNLGDMYVSDSRFKVYYDNIVEGGAEFLRDALRVYCKEEQ